MASQPDVETYSLATRIPLPVAAIVRTEAEKKGVSMSRWVAMLVERAASGRIASPESLWWIAERREVNKVVRKKADAKTRSGAYRKEGWEEVEARRKARMVKR